jgi:hypothetical protein
VLKNGIKKIKTVMSYTLLLPSQVFMELFSDAGEDVFIPTPVKEYPLVHYLKIWEMDTEMKPRTARTSADV